MKQTQICFVSSTSVVLFLFLLSPAWGQINIGDYTISGGGEIGGLPRGFKGDKARFEEYRDIPESIVVPQLQLMIGGKKEDYYLYADSYKTGLNDQKLYPPGRQIWAFGYGIQVGSNSALVRRRPRSDPL